VVDYASVLINASRLKRKSDHSNRHTYTRDIIVKAVGANAEFSQRTNENTCKTIIAFKNGRSFVSPGGNVYLYVTDGVTITPFVAFNRPRTVIIMIAL